MCDCARCARRRSSCRHSPQRFKRWYDGGVVVITWQAKRMCCAIYVFVNIFLKYCLERLTIWKWHQRTLLISGSHDMSISKICADLYHWDRMYSQKNGINHNGSNRNYTSWNVRTFIIESETTEWWHGGINDLNNGR